MNTLEEVGVETPRLDFTVDWFAQHIPVWEQLKESLPGRKKFLELGSFEGRSACWMLEHMLADDGALYCVDTWKGSPEFQSLPEGTTEQSYGRFWSNVALAKKPEQQVVTLRTTTVLAVAGLLAGANLASFDFIYIDAGHEARETLTDAVMSWPLLKTGGFMVFDDYLWGLETPIEHRPKSGIDAFAELFRSELCVSAVGHQFIVRKTV